MKENEMSNKKSIADKVEELKGKKTVDPKKIGIPAYEPKTAVVEPVDETGIYDLMDRFSEYYDQSNNYIGDAARMFAEAVSKFGWLEAFDKFNTRFSRVGEYNWRLLADIGAKIVDHRVWFLPRYMHGVRFMAMRDQEAFFAVGEVSIYKFASEKPATIKIGAVNQSDWRVAFDREKNRLRNSQEQLRYIRGKKREFSERVNWHVSKNKVVFTNACSLTKKQLQEILDLL
jgi:hypothetical protein